MSDEAAKVLRAELGQRHEAIANALGLGGVPIDVLTAHALVVLAVQVMKDIGVADAHAVQMIADASAHGRFIHEHREAPWGKK